MYFLFVELPTVCIWFWLHWRCWLRHKYCRRKWKYSGRPNWMISTRHGKKKCHVSTFAHREDHSDLCVHCSGRNSPYIALHIFLGRRLCEYFLTHAFYLVCLLLFIQLCGFFLFANTQKLTTSFTYTFLVSLCIIWSVCVFRVLKVFCIWCLFVPFGLNLFPFHFIYCYIVCVFFLIFLSFCSLRQCNRFFSSDWNMHVIWKWLKRYRKLGV